MKSQTDDPTPLSAFVVALFITVVIGGAVAAAIIAIAFLIAGRF